MLSDDESAKIFDAFQKDASLTVASAYSVLDEELHGALARIADDDQGIPPEQSDVYGKKCIARVQRILIFQQKDDLSREYDLAMTKEDKNRILRELMELDRQLKQLD